MMPMKAALLMLAITCGTATPTTMKAAVTTGSAKEGDFSKVQVVDRAVPKPGKGQVLIRVAASSINPVDWKLLTSPLAILGPKVLGFDASGTIEALGSGCTRLKVGDAVWADLGKSGLKYGAIQLGAWAQYAVADESQVGLKPQSLNFTEAASLPLAALTDYQAFKKAGSPWTGKKNLTVVVTSGSGGTGTPAIQLAKAYGAVRIITSSSPSHMALLKELGATDVFDYHKGTIWEQLTENSVDIVYDNYGAAGTADAAMPSLRSGGVFVFLPGKGGAVSKNPKAGVKQINYGLCDSSKHEDLDALKAIADKGQLKAVVQESIPLAEINRALNTSFGGHVVGKLAIDCAAGYNSVLV
jgi:NADPH:quinone reductase-like Zn-dependent oxidoreductase